VTLFLDTSALVKRYRAEEATDVVIAAMDRDHRWVVSGVVAAEARIAFCAAWSGSVPESVLDRLTADLDRCLVVPVDHECLARAAEIGCASGLRTLDAIHLAAADRLPRPVTFLTFDQRQQDAAQAMGHEVA
jgi:predicted nucleic acid-binding protein